MANEENLKPFKKGNTYGKGRPKGSKNRSTIIKEILAIVSKEVHEETGQEEWQSNEYRMVQAIVRKAIEKQDVQAFNAIYDNLYGKLKDTVDMNTTEHVNHDFKKLISGIKASS